MTSSLRVFVVTGANKGIGKSIVKLLLMDSTEKIVYLTSRNPELGKKAMEEFEAFGMHPLYHQLDITDRKSIEALRDHLMEKYGGLDVLVNNAGIRYMRGSTAPLLEQMEVTMNCNFFGTLDVCDFLFPILKKNARVVHISSLMSEFCFQKLSESLQLKFKDPSLTIEGLKSEFATFICHAREGKLEKEEWEKLVYGVSKVGISMMTILQQKEFDECAERNIIVNCCCPGVVQTDMNALFNLDGLSPDEGADTPTYLALLPTDVSEPKGCYIKIRKVHPYPPVKPVHSIRDIKSC